MNPVRNFRRTDLFLVRMWTAEVVDAGYGEGRPRFEWHGKVQRVVDGEVHQFSDWQGLADLLSAMLSKGEEDKPAEGMQLVSEQREGRNGRDQLG